MNAFLQIHKNFGLNVCVILFSLLISYVGNAQVGVGTTNPLSTFEVNGSTGQTVTTFNTDQTLDASHSIVICENGSTKITLPNAIGSKGRIYTIKRSRTNIAMVTIVPTSLQLIDGEMDYMLMNAKESVTIVSDGANWRTVVSSVPISLMDRIPMGEIGYFDVGGFAVNVGNPTVDGTSNMYPCNPPTTISTVCHGFTDGGNGKLKYTGITTKSFHIACTISMAPAGSNGTYVFELRKNGTTLLANSRLIQKFSSNNDIQSTALHAYITLDPNDYLELCVGAIGGGIGIMSIKTLNLFAMGM